MKKVILDEFKKDKVYVKDLDQDSIVGILWEDGEKTTYISFEGRYLEIDNFSKKASVTSKDIQTYINTSVTISEVYLFDTVKELFKWLSE